MARRMAVVRERTQIPYLISSRHHHKIMNPTEMANEFCSFYHKLYNLKDDPNITVPSPQAIDSFLCSLNIPIYPQLHDLNSPINVSEVEQVVITLPSGKSPGPDGFSAKYYKSFSSTLAPSLTQIFTHAMLEGSLPPEMLQATIVTLPKPGKSPDVPANFRPISLLNSDVKLFAKTLAN